MTKRDPTRDPTKFVASSRELIDAFREFNTLMLARYPLPWPDHLPKQEELEAQFEELENAERVVDADTSVHNISRRQECRATLRTSFGALIRYYAAKNEDRSALAAWPGFDLSRNPRFVSLLEASVWAPSIRLEKGEDSGTLLVTVTRVENATAYQLQYTAGDPAVEENWEGGYCGLSLRIQLRELVAGKRYAVRVRCIGRHGVSSWSEILTLAAR